MRLCQEGWPDQNQLKGVVKTYWPDRAVLTAHNRLLLRGPRLIIPSAMHNSVLEKLYQGHQGILKCKERARETVWWPGLGNQLSERILNCRTCIKGLTNPAEPLLPIWLPERL